jgi:hypothetical protein
MLNTMVDRVRHELVDIDVCVAEAAELTMPVSSTGSLLRRKR